MVKYIDDLLKSGEVELTLRVCETQLGLLQPSYFAYTEILKKYNEICRNMAYAKKSEKLKFIKSKTKYISPVYEDNKTQGVNGSAEFDSESDMEDLLSTLLENNEQYVRYYMEEWNGPGVYKIVPGKKKDYQGISMYTATFKKDTP